MIVYRRPPADVVQEGAQGDAAFGEALPDGDALLNRLGHQESERRNDHQDHPEHDHGGSHSRCDVMAREPLKDRLRKDREDASHGHGQHIGQDHEHREDHDSNEQD